MAQSRSQLPLPDARKTQRYYVYVPSLLRRPGRKSELRLARYPPRDVEPYDHEEAIDVLRIFNGRWKGSGERPPPELEPRASRVDGAGEDTTLYEAQPEYYGLPRREETSPVSET